ncbi:UNVERIFIED_CONTAM: hypothetical protein PYX00_001310 [Menopon gallinae]|uniref:CRAL-TRIO domain-containing protein n=1 Tax=Menopon gallinae TaxID=328185 RepID=A0AAW2IDL2_9NEOP
MDDNFLLRFLRIRKFNVPMAQHNLIKYLNFRQSLGHLLFNLDYLEPKVAELINSGYIFASPERDSSGRRVIIYLSDKMDPNKYTKVEMSKAHAIVYETLLEDEETQVMGVTHFADVKALGMSHISLWTPYEMAVVLRIGEQALPMRHKAIHILNFPPAFRYVFEFAVSRVSEKIKNRVMVHDSIKDLHGSLDSKCLPKEYGGTMPLAEMIDLWKQELARSKPNLLALDNMKSLVPIRRRNKIDAMEGSFKKLEID